MTDSDSGAKLTPANIQAAMERLAELENSGMISSFVCDECGKEAFGYHYPPQWRCWPCAEPYHRPAQHEVQP